MKESSCLRFTPGGNPQALHRTIKNTTRQGYMEKTVRKTGEKVARSKENREIL